MLVTSTDCKLPAVHCEHLDIETAKQISDFIGDFKAHCKGNGRITLIVTGGIVQEFEPTSRVKRKKSA